MMAPSLDERRRRRLRKLAVQFGDVNAEDLLPYLTCLTPRAEEQIRCDIRNKGKATAAFTLRSELVGKNLWFDELMRALEENGYTNIREQLSKDQNGSLLSPNDGMRSSFKPTIADQNKKLATDHQTHKRDYVPPSSSNTLPSNKTSSANHGNQLSPKQQKEAHLEEKPQDFQKKENLYQKPNHTGNQRSISIDKTAVRLSKNDEKNKTTRNSFLMKDKKTQKEPVLGAVGGVPERATNYDVGLSIFNVKFDDVDGKDSIGRWPDFKNCLCEPKLNIRRMGLNPENFPCACGQPPQPLSESDEGSTELSIKLEISLDSKSHGDSNSKEE